jgi:hypothetical protein
MPVINHMRVQQGYRPFTNPRRAMLGAIGAIGSMVPNGAVVTYQGQWVMNGTQAPDNTIAAVTTALGADGLHVVASSSDASAWSNNFMGRPYNVKLQVQIANGLGFGDPADVRSIIDHAAYVATGSMPNSSAITAVVAGSQDSGVVPPGSVPQLPDPNCASGMPYDVNGNPCPAPAGPQNFTTWLESNALWIGIGVVAAIVLPKVL